MFGLVVLILVAVVAYFVWKQLGGVGRAAGARGLLGQGEYSAPVVGESHYQNKLEAICGGRTPEGVEKYVEAALILDDNNVHDRNAVRVEIAGRLVGYLSRDFAPVYRLRLKRSGSRQVTKCPAVIRGGWDRGGGDSGHFGVWLDLA